MDSLVVEPSPASGRGQPASGQPASGQPGQARRAGQPYRAARLRRFWEEHRAALGVYAATRVVYLLIALADLVRGWPLHRELANWDGVWYLALSAHGYPTIVTHTQTTLGFLPLYAIVMWIVSHVFFCSLFVAGMLASTIGGAVATVCVQHLAERWWGKAASRRAVLFFCLFPGSIVFSMVYSEGISIPLAIGTLLALEHRRWVLAGLLAAAATAVAPVMLAIVPACAVASLIELRRHGWRDRVARRSLWAPLLAPTGAAAFGAFLLLWTGTPLASYDTQRYAPGWAEKSTPLAIVHTAEHMFHQLLSIPNLSNPGVNLNNEAGVLGAIFLLFGLWLIATARPRISTPAIVYTAGVALLTLTSANTPPNPRMLICGFPAVLVYAYALRGTAYRRLIACSTGLLLVMSALTFVANSLRP